MNESQPALLPSEPPMEITLRLHNDIEETIAETRKLFREYVDTITKKRTAS